MKPEPTKEKEDAILYLMFSCFMVGALTGIMLTLITIHMVLP